MKKIILSYILVLLSLSVVAQIPPRPEPPRLVNDLAGILSEAERDALENKLVAFNDSSSTQIAVVTVNDLGNYDPNQFAYEIGQSWGVGQKGKNNGVVILVKPKTAESGGKMAISTGYGVEDVLPDVTCKRIIENEAIPRFKQNDYDGGIEASVNTIIDIVKGKYTADQYSKKQGRKGNSGGGIFLAIIIIVIIIAVIGSNNKNNHHNINRRGSGLPLWMLLGGMGSSKSSGWGSFSSGGGGFGGFGGGGFGGGGASGSW